MDNNNRVVVKLQDMSSGLTYAIELSPEEAFRVENEGEYAQEMLQRITAAVANRNIVDNQLQEDEEQKYNPEESKSDEEEMEYENVEYLEQYDNQDPFAKKRWMSTQSLALINAVGELYEDLKHPKKRKIGWASIAESLKHTMAPVKVNSQDCRIKWRNLVRTYVNVRQNLKRTGRGPMKFEFYQEIENILAKEPNKMRCTLNAENTLQEKMTDGDMTIENVVNFEPEKYYLWDNQSTQNGAISREESMSEPVKKIWTRDQTLALIMAVGTYYEELKNPKKRKEGWENVADELQINSRDCKIKWKNLIQLYAITRNSRQNGEPTVKFSFYYEMNQVLGMNESSHAEEERAPTPVEDEPTASSSGGTSLNTQPSNFQLPSVPSEIVGLDKNKYIKFKQEKWAKKQIEWKRRHEERQEKILLQKQEMEFEKKKIALLERYLKFSAEDLEK